MSSHPKVGKRYIRESCIPMLFRVIRFSVHESIWTSRLPCSTQRGDTPCSVGHSSQAPNRSPLPTAAEKNPWKFDVAHLYKSTCRGRMLCTTTCAAQAVLDRGIVSTACFSFLVILLTRRLKPSRARSEHLSHTLVVIHQRAPRHKTGVCAVIMSHKMIGQVIGE